MIFFLNFFLNHYSSYSFRWIAIKFSTHNLRILPHNEMDRYLQYFNLLILNDFLFGNDSRSSQKLLRGILLSPHYHGNVWCVHRILHTSLYHTPTWWSHTGTMIILKPRSLSTCQSKPRKNWPIFVHVIPVAVSELSRAVHVIPEAVSELSRAVHVTRP